MTDTNGWSKAELYVMRQLDDLTRSVDGLRESIGHLNCAVHTERLRIMQETIEHHTEQIDKMSGWRQHITGAVAMLVVVGQYFWNRLSRLI